MAENPNYATVRDGKVVDEGNTEGPVPGPSQGTNDDVSMNAKTLDNMTHAELDAYAEQHQVDLTGTTTRQDKIDAINAAAATEPEPDGDGSGGDHS